MTHTPHTETDNLPAPSDAPEVPAPQQQFSREDQAFFLEYLAQCGNVRAAARKTGISRSTLYRIRRSCPQFARLWHTALLIARPRVRRCWPIAR